MKNQGRQGDVFLLSKAQSVDLSKATRIKPENGRLILARGEATGHHHSVDVQCANLFSLDGRMVLVVAEPTTLDHQEHTAIEVEPGTYWVVPQREYTPQEIRRVTD